jgi:hypothetical protein
MPRNPTQSGKEPAEGSRETIDHELKKRQTERKPAEAALRSRAPGDEAAPGTPGTGEDVCPECHGSGRAGARPCPNCNGSGRVIKAIGGA